MGIQPEFIQKLRLALPEGAFSVKSDELQSSARDFWSQQSLPGAVVRATHIDHIVQTLQYASEYHVPVVTRAAGTNICQGFQSSSDAIMLDMRPFNRVKQIDIEQRKAIVEPGVINSALQAQLKPHGMFFAPDPASAQISTIGGNIATNAGGPRCLRYGVTTHHIQEVTAVLADGSVIRLNANESGPDLRGLLIGSEGTLGIITEAVVKLSPLPETTHTLLAVFDKAELATQAVSAIIRAGIIPTALEFFDDKAARLFESVRPSGYPLDAGALLLIDVAGTNEEVQAERAFIENLLRGQARELRRAQNEEERALLWQGRIFGAQALLTIGRGFYIADTTVPRHRIHDMLYAAHEIAQAHQLELITTGHAGDGNIHPVFLFDKHDSSQIEAVQRACDELVLATLSMGGTLTGEHGIGGEKRKHMHLRFSKSEIAAQRVLKAAFDPANTLNPGILLPEPAVDEPSLLIFQQRVLDSVAANKAQRRIFPTDTSTFVSQEVQDDPDIQISAENLTVTASTRLPVSLLRTSLAAQGLYSNLASPEYEDRTLYQLLQEDIARPAFLENLLAIKATLPEDVSVHFGSENVKDVAGYDMKYLFVGSGDYFGSVQEVTLKVSPFPHQL